MTHNHVSKWYSKLHGFRIDDKYTDVTIQCEGKSYKCHRVALAMGSRYFDAMLGGGFREKNSDHIDLSESMDAATFDEMLRFLYTGDAAITSENICKLLLASDFLELEDFEAICIRFLNCQTSRPFKNTWEMLSVAFVTNRSALVDTLIVYALEFFQDFSAEDDFLALPFDVLKKIVMNQCMDEVMRDAIVRWINYSSEERRQYLDELLRIVSFENSPSTSAHEGCADDSRVESLIERAIEKNRRLLHMFVQTRERMNWSQCPAGSTTLPSRKRIRVFTLVNHRECKITYEWVQPTFATRRLVPYGNRLYSFINCDAECNTRTHFRVYSSVDMTGEQKLKLPPIVLRHPLISEMQNVGIFFCDTSVKFFRRNRLYSPGLTLFNEEEKERGIYLYNPEVDNWFPVPRLRKQLTATNMTVSEETLYLIGGDVATYVQAYDQRTREWRDLPKAAYNYSYGAACCSYKGKIYVCGGSTDRVDTTNCGREVEIYDPVAGKWESIAPMNAVRDKHVMFPYANRLWAIGDDRFSVGHGLHIDVYNPTSNEWSNPSFVTAMGDLSTARIMDAVVFKPA